jgi:hypothetical protein
MFPGSALPRQITVSAQNRDFERTHVTSTILPAEPAAAQP